MNLYKPFSLLIALALLAGCGSGSSAQIQANSNSATFKPAIANGFDQPLEASPQLVEVVTKNLDGTDLFLCSGTAIAPERVLTAGHCIDQGLPIEIRSAYGVYEASSAIIAPGFNVVPELKAIFNDAAIVIVPGLNLPALPIINSVPLIGNESLLVLGFGLDENGAYGTLKAGSVISELVTPNHVFGPIADGGAVNPCAGDSGGPLAWSTTLATGESLTGIVGIISSSTEDACNSGATLYTNLQNPTLIDFITANAPGVIIR